MKCKLSYIFGIATAILAVACTAGDDTGDVRFDCEYNASAPLTISPQGASSSAAPQQRVVVNSNIEWHLSSDAEWCTVYPDEGRDDGRFYVTAEIYANPYDRSCTLTVTNRGGKIIATIPVVQNGIEKRLTAPESISVGVGGDSAIALQLQTNINWAAELVNPADAEWVSLGEPDVENSRLPISVAPNDSDAREAKVRFYMVEDKSLFPDAVTTIRQVQHATAGNAVLRTISELLAVGYAGTIEDNIKIEGAVINNSETHNYSVDSNQVVLQDASGRAVIVTFSSSELCTFTIGQKLTLWLMGADCSADGVVSGIGAANIISVTSADDVAVEVSDLSTMSVIQHNTLVRLHDVSFVVPLGTLYNLNIDSFQCDLLVRDAAGNTYTVRTRDTYTARHALNVQSGCYNLTGIVDTSAGNSVLRLRSVDDMKHTSATAYNSIAEWYGDQSAISTTGWTVATGAGSATFGTAIGSSDIKAAFALKDCTAAYGDDNTYWGPSLKGWNGSAQSYSFTVSTASATGDIYLALWAISFGSGPQEMKVEWADAAEPSVWYDCGVVLTMPSTGLGVSNKYPLGIFSVRAAGAQGRAEVTFRVSKASDKRADGKTSAISSSGPNYMCYFGVSELK